MNEVWMKWNEYMNGMECLIHTPYFSCGHGILNEWNSNLFKRENGKRKNL